MSTTEEKISAIEEPAAVEQPAEPNENTVEAPPPAKKKGMTGEVKLFIGILVGAVVLGGAAIYPTLVGPPGPVKPPPPAPVTRPEVTRAFLIPPGSHIKGDPNAKYSLVEFSDFQCPSCKKAVPEIEKALKNQKGKLNVVFRHFQAAHQHMHSRTLGMAAEAAGLQGKFFEMAGKLFAKQDEYEAATEDDVKDIVTKDAKELGLDVERFKKAMASKEVAAKYDADQAAADKAGLNATPSFFFVPPAGKPTAISTTADMAWWVADPKNYK